MVHCILYEMENALRAAKVTAGKITVGYLFLLFLLVHNNLGDLIGLKLTGLGYDWSTLS